MNIINVKQELKDNLGKEVFIKYNLGRNKIEKFSGIIKELYNYIFIIEIKDTQELKSFMYSDIITNTIKIYYK